MRTRMALIITMVLGSALLAVPIAWADSASYCSGGKGRLFSHHTGHGQGGMMGHRLGYLLKHKQYLGLSDDQITTLRTVALDADRARIRANADRMVSERELRTMMWDAKAELPAIEAKVKEAEMSEAAVRMIGIRAKRELLAVLTPEQKTKLDALREHRHSGQESMHTGIETSPDGSSSTDASERRRSESPALPSAG
jgi:periplasmic protein CpxP/Spy